jgi:nucleotide-binding universal stress UspA family protein
VVVGVDGSPGARTALVQALTAAVRRGAALDVVTAFPGDYVYTGDYPLHVPDEEAVRRDAESRARDLLADVRRDVRTRLPAVDAVDVEVIALQGGAVRVLLEASADADLLVTGSRGRSAVRSALLGSVALHCVTHASCPVVVAHAASDAPPEARVVVGVDGSAGSRAAVAAAVEEAVRTDALLELVGCFSVDDYWTDLATVVIPSPEQTREDLQRRCQAVLDEVLQSRPEGAAVPTALTTVIEGPTGEVLVDRSRTAEMLVVGSSGHGAIRGLLLGSVALHCAMHALVPVMVVRSEPSPASSPVAQPARSGSALVDG